MGRRETKDMNFQSGRLRETPSAAVAGQSTSSIFPLALGKSVRMGDEETQQIMIDMGGLMIKIYMAKTTMSPLNITEKDEGI